MTKTLFDSDANRTMVTCIFLGAKLAEVYIKEDVLEKHLETLKLPLEVYVKTELKIMAALDYEMVSVDHTLVYHSLLLQLVYKIESKAGQRDETTFGTLVEGDLVLYKSDLFFTMHPILFALASFHVWLKKTHPSILLKELLPSLTLPGLSEINNAEHRIAEVQVFLGKNTKADQEAAAQKFKTLFQKFKSLEAATHSNQPENFKK